MAALLFASVPTACGSDAARPNGSGGSTGSDASLGAGGTGASDAATGAPGGATDGGGPITPGTLGSIWKRASTHLTGIDSLSPTNLIDDTVSLPTAVKSPEFDDRAIDVYQEAKGDALVTYSYLAGDTVYYRLEEPLTKAGDVYVTSSGDLSRIYELKDGQLVETFTYNLGTSLFVNETTFTAYTDAFPPPSWPRKVVDVP